MSILSLLFRGTSTLSVRVAAASASLFSAVSTVVSIFVDLFELNFKTGPELLVAIILRFVNIVNSCDVISIVNTNSSYLGVSNKLGMSSQSLAMIRIHPQNQQCRDSVVDYDS